MMQFPLADRLATLPPYLFAEIDRVKAAVRARGVDIISLGIGDPDMPTPDFIVEALCVAAKKPENHQYPSYVGLRSFRAAVADWYMELPPKYGAELELLHIAVESIRDIIESHKDFSAVEAREYQRTLAWIESRDLLHKLASYCLVYNPDAKKQLLIADEAASLPVFTDIRILQRVLINMVTTGPGTTRWTSP